jgi:hypothetical protein
MTGRAIAADRLLLVFASATAAAITLAIVLGGQPGLQGIFESLAASGLVATIARVLLLWTTYVRRRRFREFFGNDALRNRMCLVYPDFRLSLEAESILRQASFDLQKIYEKPSNVFPQPHRVDIPSIVASNDMESLLQIAAMFGEILQKTPPVRSDAHAVANSTDSFISFGFSSNDCTHMFLEACHQAIFRVMEEPAPTRYGEYIEFDGPDGKQRTYRSNDKAEIGIIVKYRPKFDTASDTVWLVCAGIGPKATTGAAYYLARHWQSLYEQVDAKEFICILSVTPWDYKQVHRKLVVAEGKIVYEAA